MKIEVSLTPALYPYRTIVRDHTTVAIDVLRATTAVCAAFQAGCSCVAPLDSLEPLARYRDQGFKIAAERGGRKLDGSEYGNSPTEYMSNDMRGIRLAYSTTNGTVCILRAADAKHTIVGSFANLSAVVRLLRNEQRDTVLLCSGWQNDFCIEDTLVAGAIIEGLAEDATLHGDAAHMALSLWREAKDDLYGYCRRCSHVHRLEGFGADADIRFAMMIDTCTVVPELKNGLLTVRNC